MQPETVTKPLRDLVLGFNTGSILLPQFQRDYVWKPAKIRNLLDSLLNDLPIGGFYLWAPAGRQVNAKVKTFGSKIQKRAAAYLIDGQQRLTSLEAAFELFSGEDRYGIELRCYLDLSIQSTEQRRNTKIFVSYGSNKSVKRRVDNGDPTLIEVKRFLDGRIDFELRNQTEAALRGLHGWDAKRTSNAMKRYDNACKMLDQLVPCTTIYNVTDEEAVEIFNRLNKGGTALREGDVRAAELARGPAVKVLQRMRDFVSEERPHRLGFGFSFAFRALVVFHRGSAQFKSLPADWIDSEGPHRSSLAETWDETQDSLSEALRFVDEKMAWSRRAFVPSANAIIVLAYALSKAGAGRIAPDAEKKYRKWLCLIALRGLFQGSVETTINRFVRAVRDTRKHPSIALIEGLTRNEARRIQPEEFAQYAQLWGPATQVLHSWLVRRKARDWLNGELLDALARSGDLGLAGGNLTVHHIFSRAVAADHFANPNDANCLANFAILSRNSNSEINEREPEDALQMLSAKQLQLASEQFFGTEAGDRLKVENFESFRDWRAQRLADAFNEDFGLK